MSEKNVSLESFNAEGESEKKKDKKETKNVVHAELMAERQRDIGVAEFFSRNRHLLGFDNKKKSLMTTIKEAVISEDEQQHLKVEHPAKHCLRRIVFRS